MGRSGNEDVVVKKCKDCGGSGKGPVKGTICSTCGGNGQTITLVHRR